MFVFSQPFNQKLKGKNGKMPRAIFVATALVGGGRFALAFATGMRIT
jgi:hypothetical protein